MSFELPLSDKYRLTSDTENVILQHKETCKGEVVWRNIAYYQTIGKAVEYYIRLVQRKSSVKGWAGLYKLTKALQTDVSAITQALDIQFSDTPKDSRAPVVVEKVMNLSEIPTKELRAKNGK